VRTTAPDLLPIFRTRLQADLEHAREVVRAVGVRLERS
jgi:hypothetical protein